MSEAEKEEDLNVPLIAEAPLACSRCGAGLCLRKQVINLALGNAETMLCLACLGQEGSQPAEEVLSGIKTYVLSRDCFRKEWIKYRNVKYCPDPEHCYPLTCFKVQE